MGAIRLEPQRSCSWGRRRVRLPLAGADRLVLDAVVRRQVSIAEAPPRPAARRGPRSRPRAWSRGRRTSSAPGGGSPRFAAVAKRDRTPEGPRSAGAAAAAAGTGMTANASASAKRPAKSKRRRPQPPRGTPAWGPRDTSMRPSRVRAAAAQPWGRGSEDRCEAPSHPGEAAAPHLPPSFSGIGRRRHFPNGSSSSTA